MDGDRAQTADMGIVRFDHTIVPSTDKERSARWYAELLDLGEVRTEPPFACVDLGNDVTLAFGGWDTAPVASQHYAFHVDESRFDAVLERLVGQGVDYYADSSATRVGEINRDDGGRGLYFRDPDGNFLELITVRYGGRPLAYADPA